MEGLSADRARSAFVALSFAALAGLPIFMAHGKRDRVVPIRDARAARDQLSTLSVALTYHEYAMGHQVTVESMKDIVPWLKARLDESHPQIE